MCAPAIHWIVLTCAVYARSQHVIVSPCSSLMRIQTEDSGRSKSKALHAICGFAKRTQPWSFGNAHITQLWLHHRQWNLSLTEPPFRENAQLNEIVDTLEKLKLQTGVSGKTGSTVSVTNQLCSELFVRIWKSTIILSFTHLKCWFKQFKMLIKLNYPLYLQKHSLPIIDRSLIEGPARNDSIYFTNQRKHTSMHTNPLSLPNITWHLLETGRPAMTFAARALLSCGSSPLCFSYNRRLQWCARP